MKILKTQVFPCRQFGFTLVEIAIVLVIIGLLLGGMLKGQELVNSAKVKNHISDLKAIPLFVYSYQDKYRALPGDDAKAKTHLGDSALEPGSTRGNGIIEGNYNSVSNADESVAFWQHVRLANLTTGPTDFTTPSSVLPTNADGGRIGIQSKRPIADMVGSCFVCSDGIQGKFARQIDIAMDDGDTAKGSVRVMAAGYSGSELPAISTASLVDSASYTVCVSF